MAAVQKKLDDKHPDKDSLETKEMQAKLHKQFELLVQHQAKKRERERQRTTEDHSKQL